MADKVKKCEKCGRDKVPITKKGLYAPHITPGGRRCMIGHPNPYLLQNQNKEGL